MENALESSSNRYYQAALMKAQANEIFEKKFQFCKTDGVWNIEEQPFFKEYYEFPNLIELEEQLNLVKSKLNKYDIVEWSTHTRKTNPTSEVVWKLKNTTQVEFGTIAWAKFYECLHRYPLVKGPRLNSLHLCEAPGAFIAALNHFLHSTFNETDEIAWKWFGTTLNPYYEGNTISQMIADDRFICNTLDNWVFFEDFVGNIISSDSISQLERECKVRFDGSVQLITADGSVDCWEKPDLQEDTVSLLHWAEITAALSILAEGGCFVLKMFTLFKSSSVSKMYLLNCVFDSVEVFKPATSKGGNSEVYIICIGYKKNTPYLSEILCLLKNKLKEDNVQKFQTAIPLFAKAHLPKNFLMQHEVCARLFMNHQINTIESNIYSYSFKHPNMGYCGHVLRVEVCKQFYERYQIRPLNPALRIVKNQKPIINKNHGYMNPKVCYSDKECSDAMKISTMINDINELEKLLDLRIDINYEFESSPIAPVYNWNTCIHVYHSKPVAKVHSSLFINMPLLLLYTKVVNEYNKNSDWIINSTCHIDENDSEKIHWNDIESKDFASAQQQFYQRVLHACLVDNPQKLTFNNLLVLTHYGASILRYLSLYVFDRINITNNGMGIITLSINTETERKTWPERSKALKDLQEVVNEGINIFCFMKLNELHGNDFNTALVRYNDRQLSRYINIMLGS